MNSLKHGLAGAGVVMTPEIETEVDRRTVEFMDELRPSGPVGRALVRRAAFQAVRLDLAMRRENQEILDRVRRAKADFVLPSGVDAAEAHRLRLEAGRLASYEVSPEMVLNRRYEDAAERGMIRCLKELRQVERAAKADVPQFDPAQIEKMLGSIGELGRVGEELEALYPEVPPTPPIPTANRLQPTYFPPLTGVSEVPISIGRRR